MFPENIILNIARLSFFTFSRVDVPTNRSSISRLTIRLEGGGGGGVSPPQALSCAPVYISTLDPHHSSSFIGTESVSRAVFSMYYLEKGYHKFVSNYWHFNLKTEQLNMFKYQRAFPNIAWYDTFPLRPI